MNPLPKKLTSDPIAEAICEIRFDSQDSDEVPEVALGKLSQHESWAEYKTVRLPLSDMPAPVRKQDPNLKHQPTLELRSPDSKRVVKLGPNVASYHCLAPYPGWESFERELSVFLEHTFSTLRAFVCTRLGFRYVNTFSAARHTCVKGIESLNLDILVAQKALLGPKNLNYSVETATDTTALVRVAAPEFVNAPSVSDLTALIDIDVTTKGSLSIQKSTDATIWIDQAHTQLKQQFFRLFTDQMMLELIEV